MEPKTESVKPSLRAKNDGRKKAWWVKKIEKLEGEIEMLKAQNIIKGHSVTNGEAASHIISGDDEWAEGFVTCMRQFQVMNKAGINRVLQQLKEHGKGYAKRIKGGRFRGMTL